jgi:hypothetical protein
MDYTLLFASVTCLQWFIRWDTFVLGAQPLDMSPLSLCWHNKTLLRAICLKSPVSQQPPTTFLGALYLGLWRWWIITSLVTRVCPPGPSGWDPSRHQWTTWSGRGFLLPWSQGEGLRYTMEPSEAHESAREGNTAHQIAKNPCSNSGLPQEAERELDHLPMGHPCNCPFFGVKLCLSGSGSGMEVLCCVRVYKNVSWDTAQLWSKWGVSSCSVCPAVW